MAYRSGTYIAFHANGIKEPTESDIKYYNLLKAWHANEGVDFSFVDSHEKTGAIRDSSKRATVARSLKERLCNSKNMVLIIGKTTHEDTDWVPLEIEQAIDVCKIPIIAAYPGYRTISAPSQLAHLWPVALYSRIASGAAHVIHIPFCRDPVHDAIQQFNYSKYPNGGGLGIYDDATYRSWGLV